MRRLIQIAVPLLISIIFSSSPTEACFALGTGCMGPGCVAHYPAYCAYRYCGAAASAAAAKRASGAKIVAIDDGFSGTMEKPEEWAAGAIDGKRHTSSGKSVPETPDELFVECCEAWSLPSQCLSKCNYFNYTAEALRSMFFRSDECPIEAASVIHYCSSQNRDHSACCERSGISTTSAGAKCLIFCEPMPKNETTLNFSFIPCLERFKEIKKCFFEDALREVDYLEMEVELEAERKFQSEGALAGKSNIGKNGVKGREGSQFDSSFVITRPPIVFVNTWEGMRTPKINDDYAS